MALHLYRRHRRDCKAGRAEDSLNSEFDERRKGWKRCECPITASGTLAGKYRRQSTAQWEWDAARKAVAAWELAGNWTSSGPAHPTPDSPAQHRTTLEDALSAFSSRAISRGILGSTQKKYRTFKKQFLAYGTNHVIVYTDQLTIADADRFYASIPGGARSRGNKLGMLRSFVRFAIKRKWLTENIAEDLEAPTGVSHAANRTPFTDEELERMQKACDQIGPPIPGGPGMRPWGGEDVRDFILISIYTGLRISDVCLFDVSKRLDGNNVFLRMHKTQKPLETWIPDFLVDRLRAREQRLGPMIFLTGKSLNVATVTEQWRRRMGRVFKLAGPFEEKPVVHRFRGTFARILLERGVGEEDVAILLGDTVPVLRKFYGRWIKTRQDRLSKILQDAFAERPTGKVVAIR